jgi:hypothetical protein
MLEFDGSVVRFAFKHKRWERAFVFPSMLNCLKMRQDLTSYWLEFRQFFGV